MRRWLLRSTLAVLAGVTLSSCSDTPNTLETIDPVNVTPRFAVEKTDVRISELHYDNAGTDTGERIEIAGPADFNLSGWSVVFYNGSNGLQYRTLALSGVIPNQCNGQGTLFFSLPVDGIQNGSPDGLVLVAPGSNVVERLSYEGGMTAVDGVAAGQALPNIPVAEDGATPVGHSLWKDQYGEWHGPAANTFGACNARVDDEDPVVDYVTVTPATATIDVAQQQQFIAKAFTADSVEISGVTFAWSSSSAAALVDGNGLATGAAEGSATITAEVDGISAGALLTVEAAEPPSVGDVVISQVYGGGGNSGATYNQDFVELFNRGDTPANVTGWRVLYASSTGTSWTGATLSTLTIPAGGYVLVGFSTVGTTGAALPATVATGTPAMGASNGKVILAMPGTVTAVACPSDAIIIDRVNFGTGNCGTTAGWSSVTGLGNAAAGLRLNDGCVDNNDAADFTAGTPMPRNHTSPTKDCDVPPPPPEVTKLVINELHATPINAAGGATWGEWFEVHNYGDTPIDLQGWKISSSGQPEHTIASSVVVAAGGYAVLGRGSDRALNGNVVLNYNYFTGSTSTIFLDNADVLTLRDADGDIVDAVTWANGTIAGGVSRAVSDATADNANAAGANWGHSTTQFGDGDYGTPGAANGTLSNTAPNVKTITFIRRDTNEGPLPVGFEDQLFADLIGSDGAEIPTTFTWTSETPDLATVDNNGVVHALGVGTAILRATAADGTTRTVTMTTEIATQGTASYADNTEFGTPTDSDAGDDFILTYPEYTSSFNKNRGTPNWVAYEIDATHFGATDRCNCFTYDAALPFERYTTADYTGAGAFHGTGYDRGHLARSFDRTSGRLDNARTFQFSNIIPQAAFLNQQAWAQMENYLGNLARTGGKEVYVIAGATGDRGTVKNEGKITIPTMLWKVAVIMPVDRGLNDVVNASDIEVIAITVANDSVRGHDNWETWRTTVDAVEALSGYDLLDLLPDQIEIAVESNTKPPVAVLDGPYTSSEGSTVNMSAAGSSDPDAGQTLTYSWAFSDGGSASGVNASHTFTQDGTYSVTLTVTDNLGLTNTTSSSVTVGNVAPSVNAFAGATLLPGETYSASGTFSDPGSDVWTATVDYGDGTSGALALSGQSFTLSHVYTAAGIYTVTVNVSDDDATSSNTATVTVLSPSQGVNNLLAMVGAAGLNAGNTNALGATLNAAINSMANGNNATAVNQLNAFINQVNAFEQSGKLTAAQAAALRAEAERVIASIS